MNAGTKLHNVTVAINTINMALSQLEKVANEDGERGIKIREDVIGPIINFVGPDDGYYHNLYNWMMDLEDEAKK